MLGAKKLVALFTKCSWFSNCLKFSSVIFYANLLQLVLYYVVELKKN